MTKINIIKVITEAHPNTQLQLPIQPPHTQAHVKLILFMLPEAGPEGFQGLVSKVSAQVLLSFC